MTQELDMTDAETVKYFTGLENIDNIEYVVASEPMMSSQAYSMVLVKVKDGADIDAIANAMNENVEEKKVDGNKDESSTKKSKTKQDKDEK